MSFLTLRVPVTRSSMLVSSRSLPVSASLSRYSGFHSSPVQSALSEDDRHSDSLPNEIEKHKQDSLQKQKTSQGEWKQELASESEASIKADRSEIKASEQTIKQMEEETEKLLKKREAGEFGVRKDS